MSYHNYERDALVIEYNGVNPTWTRGKIIRALNLDECELFEGKVTLENDE